ncbi:MAG: EVE domain-containing protein [Cytophagia bacterium]|nr:MAG: EVE domain-containing protein [Cytophagia bacterium]TAH30572.1 MAG: EVE domain-containing protein [Cytophagales bacterium]
MKYWLIKSEPDAYSWQDLENEQIGRWDGVRNYQARNNLKSMEMGDLCLFYHSVTEKQVVGIAEVVNEYYPDTTAEKGDWVCIDVKPYQKLPTPVTLAQIKNELQLNEMALLKQSRLSVCPLTKDEFDCIIKMGQ